MSGKYPIAWIAGAFPLRSETFVWREVRELRRRGWDIHPFGLRPPDEQTPPELVDLREQTRYLYTSTPSDTSASPAALGSTTWLNDLFHPGEALSLRDRLKLPLQARAGRRLARWARTLGIRHVHAHFAHAPASVAMYAAQAAGLSFSFTGHANDLFQRRQLLLRKLERAAFVSCISQWHRDWYHSIAPNARYEVIRCGVPLEAYGPAPEPVEGKLRVLSVARLVEKKGLDLLIRAAARVPVVEVTLAGSGPQLPHLQSLAETSGARVRFLGAVDPSTIADELRQHDAFVLPCRPTASGDRDGIPVALMEAMASGLPVISGDLPAIRELITHGRSGLLVDTGSGSSQAVEAVREGLQRLSEDRRWCRDLGKAGQERVRTEFGLTQNVDRLERMLMEVAAPGKS